MESRVQEYFETAGQQTSDLVEARPISAATVAFGIGVVTGIFAVAMLSREKESSLASMERQAANYAKHFMDRLSAITPTFMKG